MDPNHLVNLYPLSSVEAESCYSRTEFPMETGFQTNWGVLSNSMKQPLEPLVSDCYDRIQLSSHQTKPAVDNVTPINPEVYSDKRMKDYNLANRFGCQVYYNEDPRLIEPIRYHQSYMDTPPLNSRIRMKDVYTEPSLASYDVLQGKPYEDIRDGQILYYKSEATEGPFISPVFGEGIKYNKVLFQDPMGAVKTQYEIVEPACGNQATTIRSNPCSLFIEDTGNFREALMTMQMSKMNARKWSARWMEQ